PPAVEVKEYYNNLFNPEKFLIFKSLNWYFSTMLCQHSLPCPESSGYGDNAGTKTPRQLHKTPTGAPR
ncbi:MAG TPA: hypothetical protein PJ987_12965, partial [Bacteroidia bacterium]|nr:hypothetical protein [Bacteroidia bacterium]